MRISTAALASAWVGLHVARSWAGDAGFTADFETGTFYVRQVPAGPFSEFAVTDPWTDAGVFASAAHRGTYGLRVFDWDAGAGAPANGVAANNDFGAASAGAVYLRTWVRPLPDPGAGPDTTRVLGIRGTAPAGKITLASGAITWQAAGTKAQLEGHDGLGNELSPEVAFGFDGGWHLFELAALGLDSDAGSRLLWLDGTLVLQTTQVDWTDAGWDRVQVGEIFDQSHAFAGTIDFDDVRSDTSPLASTLTVDAGTAVPSGACVPLTVTLVDSPTGAPSPAPYPFSANLSATNVPAVAFFSDGQCTIATTQASFAAGVSTVSLAMRGAASGPQALTAGYVDFLSIPAGVVFVAAADAGAPADAGLSIDAGADAGTPNDAGTPSASARFAIGCGSAAGQSAAWVMALCVLALRRSKRNSVS